MTTLAANSPARVTDLRRHIRLVLVVMPALYMAHGFFPTSQRLWADNDHSAFAAFWFVIAVLHWGSALVAWRLLRRHGVSLHAIGLRVTARQALAVVLGLAGLGLVLVVLRSQIGEIGWFAGPFRQAGAASTPERLVWILIAMTAGLCEEFVYRGFAIAGQRAAGVGLPTALAWSTIAFVLLHGFGAFAGFLLFASFGLAMALIYLRTDNLVIPMAVHTTVDLLAMFVA